jgi:RHS repeat-associated protein
VPHANWRGLYESGTVVGRSQCNIDIYLPYGEVVFMDSTGRRKVHPAIVMDQEGFELDTTQTRCIEIDFPGKAMGMRHLLRQNTVAGPISWMGSLVQDNQDASGLMYRRNRFYDPKSGRFTQEDPIGLAGGVNLYGFAAGDPVSYDDPYGLAPEEGTQCRIGRVCLWMRAGQALRRWQMRSIVRRAETTVDEQVQARRARGAEKLAIPSTPNGMNTSQFGSEDVMGWGRGTDAARERIYTLDRGQLERAGVTPEIAQE